jgi:LCP family protein required for cell wall assembly
MDVGVAPVDPAEPVDPAASANQAASASPADPVTVEPIGPVKPVKQRKPRSPLWAKASIAVGLVIMLSALGILGGEKLLTARYAAALHPATLLAPDARRDVPQRLSGPLNYLLIGSDARADNPSMGARSDTIIILHIPATLDRAYLISIPRDLRVNIPPFAPKEFAGTVGKINSSFQYGGAGAGGVQLLSATLTQLIGVTFDGAAVVDFSGFDKIVGDLGGVHMCLDEGVKSIHTGHVFHAGCQYLTAKQALDYLRQRETLPGGDFDRERHQQQFLQAVFSSMFSNGLTSNPLEIDKIIRAVGSSMTVDLNGIPLDQLLYTLRNVQPSSLQGIRVPAGTQTIGGVSFVLQTSAADGLYGALDEDTLGTWVQANPQWVNAL